MAVHVHLDPAAAAVQDEACQERLDAADVGEHEAELGQLPLHHAAGTVPAVELISEEQTELRGQPSCQCRNPSDPFMRGACFSRATYSSTTEPESSCDSAWFGLWT